VVALWRIAAPGRAVPEVVSAPPAPAMDPVWTINGFDVIGLLERWGHVVLPRSMWVGCRLEGDNWQVAPVRIQPPSGPPTGIERRSPERLVVELAGLCCGALEPAWVAADQTYLRAELEVLENTVERIRTTLGLNVGARSHSHAPSGGMGDSTDETLRA
jgi:hypothetical protein